MRGVASLPEAARERRGRAWSCEPAQKV